MTAPSRAQSPDALREAMERAKAYLNVGFGPIQADLRLILQAAEAREEAERERDRLRERLELDHAWQMGQDGELVRVPAPEGMPDGIECRDATIRLLEERIQAALAAKEEAERRIAGLEASLLSADADLQLLALAVNANDPLRELKLRIEDLRKIVRAALSEPSQDGSSPNQEQPTPSDGPSGGEGLPELPCAPRSPRGEG